MTQLDEDYKEISTDRIIPDIVKVMIIDLPVGNEITGKVDTGADICSMHAENIEINRGAGKVSFDCKYISDKRITMVLSTQQAVRTPSSDEVMYRPVVRLNIKVSGKALNDIEVNLNDRSKMEQPFLIGQNALEAGNFIIDPNIMKEDEQTDNETTVVETPIVEKRSLTQQEISSLYDLFEKSDMTLSEMVEALREEAINRINKIKY